jgi:CobQ-like glutamine amidotransferase family enzyme
MSTPEALVDVAGEYGPVDGPRVEIVLVYQSLLGIYGDRGNATVLARRLAWRGFDAVLTVVEPGEALPDTGHVYLLGGGEDAAQVSAVRALQADGGLHRAVDRGAVVFAVCAGYQIAGRTFTVGDPTVPGGEDQVIEGLGLLDVTTTRGPRRAVGEILSRWRGRGGDADDSALLTGFENHGGWTRLGPDGIGNADDGTEGAMSGTVVATYPHGPVLARNPALADHLLTLALGEELAPLHRPEIDTLRAQRLAAVRSSR